MVKVTFIDGRGQTHTRTVRANRVAHCIALHERQGMEYYDEEAV